MAFCFPILLAKKVIRGGLTFHICMITREFPPESGGIGYYVYNLSRKLLESGHRITILTRGREAKTIREMVAGIDVFKVSFFPFYPLHMSIHGVFINMIFKKLESEFDLVHFHSPIVPQIKTSLPILTTVHTSMKIDSKYHEVFDFQSFAERLQSRVIYPPLESNLFNISNSITAVSSSVVEELATYGIDPMKVTVVGNGVNENLFIPDNSDKIAEKYILYTGVLRARKGLFDLLDCAELVCKVCKDVKFIVCGAGPFFNKLREKVERKKMKKQFVLSGYVERDKLVQLYQKATVHVVPSHYEGMPTVLLEAMSCGLPVVATAVGGNSQAISNGINGFLIPPKSPKAMANVILKLLADDALRKRIGEAARRTIETRYTWDKITANILRCYKNLLQ